MFNILKNYRNFIMIYHFYSRGWWLKKVEKLVANIHDTSKYVIYVINLKQALTLREKCPNTELFLVRIFLYSDWIRALKTVNLRIQSEHRKIRTRSNSELFGHFSRRVNHGLFFGKFQWVIKLNQILG